MARISDSYCVQSDTKHGLAGFHTVWRALISFALCRGDLWPSPVQKNSLA